jgi:hypothetical protein
MEVRKEKALAKNILAAVEIAIPIGRELVVVKLSRVAADSD